jgi:hypothetical protein
LVIDRLVEGVSVATLLAACLLAVVQVFFRYVLNNSLPWPEEVARLGFVWVVFLGMALGDPSGCASADRPRGPAVRRAERDRLRRLPCRHGCGGLRGAGPSWA